MRRKDESRKKVWLIDFISFHFKSRAINKATSEMTMVEEKGIV